MDISLFQFVTEYLNVCNVPQYLYISFVLKYFPLPLLLLFHTYVCTLFD